MIYLQGNNMKEMKHLIMIAVALASVGALFVGVRHFMKKRKTKEENVQIQKTPPVSQSPYNDKINLGTTTI